MTNIYVDNYLKMMKNLVVNWQQYLKRIFYSVSLLSFQFDHMKTQAICYLFKTYKLHNSAILNGKIQVKAANIV